MSADDAMDDAMYVGLYVGVPQEDQLEYLVVFNRCAFYSPYFVTGNNNNNNNTTTTKQHNTRQAPTPSTQWVSRSEAPHGPSRTHCCCRRGRRPWLLSLVGCA
jgi:hypothetical protein